IIAYDLKTHQKKHFLLIIEKNDVGNAVSKKKVFGKQNKGGSIDPRWGNVCERSSSKPSSIIFGNQR
ncbi:hypothetical protein JTB14_001313, partial [Gonioctena quinquepunctata]